MSVRSVSLENIAGVWFCDGTGHKGLLMSKLYCIEFNKQRFYALLSDLQSNDIICAIKLFDFDDTGNIDNIVSEPGGSQLSKLLIIWYKKMISMIKYYCSISCPYISPKPVISRAWDTFTKMNSILIVTSPFGWIMYSPKLKNVEYFTKRNQVSIYVQEVLDIYIPEDISGNIIDYMFGVNLDVGLCGGEEIEEEIATDYWFHTDDWVHYAHGRRRRCSCNGLELNEQQRFRGNVIARQRWRQIDYIYE